MEFKPLGERAMLIEFEKRIDPEIHRKVMRLSQAVREMHMDGLVDQIIAYCSVTLLYDPLMISYEVLKKRLMSVDLEGETPGERKPVVHIPVCYDPEWARDLSEVSRLTGLAPEDVISIHEERTYFVYMIGFLPGFVYLGEVDERIRVGRKAAPRPVSKGSVGLAHNQTGIYPSDSPGGWQIIGKTPVSLFNPGQEDPFPVKPGERVRFRKLPRKDFDLISRDKNYQPDRSDD